MRISSNAYRDTKHPGDLHEFLNRALLEETETEADHSKVPAHPARHPGPPRVGTDHTLEHPTRKGTDEGAAALATMQDRRRLARTWRYGTQEDGFSGNEIPPELLSMLDQSQAD